MFNWDNNIHGLQIIQKEPTITTAALVSLRTALKSYFGTYRIIQTGLSLTELSYQDRWCVTSLDYQEKYLQTIFHFHHFFELLFKDSLRSIYPLFALKINTNDTPLLKRLIEGHSPTELDTDTIEFISAKQRLIKFKDDSEAPKLAKTISKPHHSASLNWLNTLRNRAWHRGAYLLRYTELDQFIGSRILPLVDECMVKNPLYTDSIRYWKYHEPEATRDPIDAIISTSTKDRVHYDEIAFFKEVGLASYEIDPFFDRGIFNLTSEAEDRVKVLASHRKDIHSVRDCFVCGQESLVLYMEADAEFDHHEGNVEFWSWEIVYVKCESCGLELSPDIGNPSKYGIDSPDIWLSDSNP